MGTDRGWTKHFFRGCEESGETNLNGWQYEQKGGCRMAYDGGVAGTRQVTICQSAEPRSSKA